MLLCIMRACGVCGVGGGCLLWCGLLWVAGGHRVGLGRARASGWHAVGFTFNTVWALLCAWLWLAVVVGGCGWLWLCVWCGWLLWAPWWGCVVVWWVVCFLYSGCEHLFCLWFCLVVVGIRWMPWYQELMKDVVACDMPRGVGERAVIRGCPNGGT